MVAAEVGHEGGGGGDAEFWQPTSVKDRVSVQDFSQIEAPHALLLIYRRSFVGVA